MTSHLLGLFLVPVLASPLDDSAATELRYTGTLSQVARNGSESPVKQFEVYCVLLKGPGDGRRIAFLVDEKSNGWAWPERYGMTELDGAFRPTGKARPQLLQEHDGTPNPVALRLPVFEETSRLKEGAEWVDGKLAYSVGKKKKVQDRDCWTVEVATNFGRSQTLAVDAASGVLVSVDQRLFMGRGDQYSLKMQLEGTKPLTAADASRIEAPLVALLKLQKDLKRAEGETKPDLSESQIALAAEASTALEKEAAETPFAKLAAVIARDAKSQSQRAGDVESLAKKFVGQPAPAFMLKSISGTAVEPEEYKDKIVVLHFYKYHGEPLVEPYGQVGYLDFLNNRRGKLGVKIYGVAVDDRFGDAVQAPAAARQVRKFLETMNVSYPVTTDDGKLLSKFGDPRRVGAKLPVWIVIAPDGKVAHYKAGYYDIRPDEGLKALDEILISEIRKAKGSEK